jgi:hypothetical protein
MTTHHITLHSESTNQTITATGSEPELQTTDQHVTTQVGHLQARLNQEHHKGASDWAGTVHLPGPLNSGS